MNFLTEKLSGRGEIDLVNKGLLPVPQEAEGCRYEFICPDIQKLKKSHEEGIPDEDLMDQYHELCGHPEDGARETSCGQYREFKKAEKIFSRIQVLNRVNLK